MRDDLHRVFDGFSCEHDGIAISLAKALKSADGRGELPPVIGRGPAIDTPKTMLAELPGSWHEVPRMAAGWAEGGAQSQLDAHLSIKARRGREMGQ
jgi:hypothetical protein